MNQLFGHRTFGAEDEMDPHLSQSPQSGDGNQISMLWHPQGFNYPALVGRALTNAERGDMPNIRMPVRLIGIDTPETNASTDAQARKIDEQFLELAQWIRKGKVKLTREFTDYTLPRLEAGHAAALQMRNAKEASVYFDAITKERLCLPSGRRRELFIRAGEQSFDYGNKLLVYLAPRYNDKELRSMSRKERSTFNLDYIRAGWAAPFVIYPNIPGEYDMPLLIEAVSEAIEAERGIWRDHLRLLPYEYRLLTLLYDVTKNIIGGANLSAEEQFGFRSRYCVDMRSLVIYSYDGYGSIPPQYRLWVWRRHLRKAISDLNLKPSPNLVV